MAETFLAGSRPRHVTSARGTSYSPERPGEHRDDSATHDKNQQGSRHSLFECVYQIWGLYIIFKAMNADKWLTYFWL